MEERPYPTWDDRSIIEPPPHEERRLVRTRVDRLHHGSLLRVERNSRRLPWWSLLETWIMIALKDRENEIALSGRFLEVA
eukprot:1344317-Amphidinium_carterae.1